MRRAAVLWVVLLCTVWLAAPAQGQEWDNEECLGCHAYEDVVEVANDPRPGLIFDSDHFARSTHAELLCIDCHTGLEGLPHDSQLPAVDPTSCEDCHDVEQYLRSAHGTAWRAGDEDAPTCSSCHGFHDVHYVEEPGSRVSQIALAATCGQCHGDELLAQKHSLSVTDAYGQYTQSVHGRAISASGLLVAATCKDCHGGHEVQPSEDPRSSIAPANLPATCGQCHTGIPDQFAASVHGQLLASGNEDGPTCSTCHAPHELTEPGDGLFAAQAVNECRNCHAEMVDTYRGTYHGKVNALGDVRIAACTSCHTAHHILPADDPASSVSIGNRLATCQECHPTATTNFAEYRVHADPTDFDKNPWLFAVVAAMTTLLSTVMIVSLTHVALWYRKSRVLAKETVPTASAAATLESGPYVMRLSAYNRVLHMLVIISFFLLVMTGIPLHFSENAWARWMVSFFGGFGFAAFLHRVGAVMTLGYAVLHLGNIACRRWARGERGLVIGPDTLLPNLNDARQIVGHIKWFLGKGPRPQFGRWTYWEKFDYFAVFFGVNVIGWTGLLLWFPEFFTRWLPGWAINVATIVHGDEALLAMSFIFSVHFFNVHLRPGRFMLDPLFLTGRITLEELREERPVEYAALQESGQLEDSLVEPASPVLEHYAGLVGYTAVVLGALLFFTVAISLFYQLFG